MDILGYFPIGKEGIVALHTAFDCTIRQIQSSSIPYKKGGIHSVEVTVFDI